MPDAQHTVITALSAEEQQQVIEKTRAYIRQATHLFDIKEIPVDIVFNLKGRTAGMYRVKQNLLRHKREIRYNPYIFAKYFTDNLNTTVPHEVAHYVSDIIYGLRNIKPHGSEWKDIMQAFGADATVTASYDLTGIPQKNLNFFTYQCGCGDRQLSSIRHNRIQKKRYRYYCRVCRQTLSQKTSVV